MSACERIAVDASPGALVAALRESLLARGMGRGDRRGDALWLTPSYPG